MINIKIGDKVIVAKNQAENFIFKGSTGTVLDINGNDIRIQFNKETFIDDKTDSGWASCYDYKLTVKKRRLALLTWKSLLTKMR